MEFWAIAAFSAVAGFCAKFSDEVADRELPMVEAFAAALLWGLLAGVLTVTTDSSSLFLAMAAGTLLAGKIDHVLHYAGLLAFLCAIILIPLQSFSPWLFCLFLVAALLDEIELPWGFVRLLGENRLWLPAATLVAGIWTGQWLFFGAIVCFDIAYKAADYASGHLFRTGKAADNPSGRLFRPRLAAKKKPSRRRK